MMIRFYTSIRIGEGEIGQTPHNIFLNLRLTCPIPSASLVLILITNSKNSKTKKICYDHQDPALWNTELIAHGIDYLNSGHPCSS